MVKSNLFCALFFGLVFTSSAQRAISLDSCVNAAYRNFTLDQNIDLTNQITDAKQKQVGKNYLPSLELNAMATYQNEQITIPVEIPIPGFEAPAAPLNLNTALFSIKQWVYDGSQTHYQKLLEEASGNASLQEIEVQRLELKTAVMQHYFAIVLKEKQRLILEDKQKVLLERIKEVNAAVASHMLLEADANLLKAELIKLKQQLNEVRFSAKESLEALAQLTGLELNESIEFALPNVELSATQDLNLRPDVQLLNRQMDMLEAQKMMTKSAYLPRIGVFADGGFGLPGYNFFDDNVAPMAKVGISLHWNLFDWNKGSLQRQTLSLNQQIIRIKQDQLKTQVGVKTRTQLASIGRAKVLMQDDVELVQLYNSVAEAYAAQLENGTITAAEYIMQLNKVQEAQSNLELHKMQLVIATINYNTLMGE